MDQVKITEATVSFTVRGKPKIPVDDAVSFAIDTRANDTERVLPSSVDIDSMPEWVLSCKKGYMMFTYAFGHQNVECTFRESQSALVLHGVKYGNLEAICGEGQLDIVFGMLGVVHEDGPCTVYKAVMIADTGAPWDRDLIADTITNNPKVSQVAAVSERTETLGNRRLFSMLVVTENGEHARVTLRRDEADERRAVVTMSGLPDTKSSVHVASVVKDILRAYRADCGKATPRKSPHSARAGFVQLTGIGQLRRELPELFVNNYTRECPVLPVMVSQEHAALLDDVQRVILYPLEGPFRRYYTAPKGYIVGLKKNRLSNKDMFPWLVTCYLHDHMLRRGSDTYTYYTGDAAKGRKALHRPVPRSMGYGLLAGYDRKRAASFVNALEIATGRGVNLDDLPYIPQVARQEMWDMSDEHIMGTISSNMCGPLAYRYFEELLGVSIHVVVISNGMLEPLVAALAHNRRQGDRRMRNDVYMWEPPYRLNTVIFETAKRTYGKTELLYDVLTKNNRITMFDIEEPAVASIVVQGRAVSVPPGPVHCEGALRQLIDERGRCRTVELAGGGCTEVLTRPLTIPVMPNPACFFDLHVQKMNDIKVSIGVPTVDLYKRSTNRILYFPNDASFSFWIGRFDA